MTARKPKLTWAGIAEATFWTAVSSAGVSLTSTALFSLDGWQSAGMAGANAVVNGILWAARWRSSLLPNPGTMFVPDK